MGRLLELRIPEGEFDEKATFVSKVQKVFEMPEFANDGHYRTYLLTLNSLRNSFAHRAGNIVSDIRTVLNEIPAVKRDEMMQSLAVGIIIPGSAEADPRNRSMRIEFMLKCPREMVFLSAIYAIQMITTAYYFHPEKYGLVYPHDYKRELQDLLHDPAVLEFNRNIARALAKGDGPLS
jgi:hypothetical protein